MKKIFAALLVTVMAVSVSACSSPAQGQVSGTTSQSSTVSSVQESSNTVDSSTEESSNIESSVDSSKEFQTIDEFIESDQAQQIVTQVQETAGDIMTFKLLAEDGNKLIYEYTYAEQIEVDVDVIRDSLNSMTSTYAASAEYIGQIVNVENPYVVIRYVNADGTLIYEQAFNADSVYEESSDDESSEEESSDDDTSSFLTGQYASIEEYLQSNEAQQIIESTQETLGDVAVFDIKAEDSNKLIYEYAYVDVFSDTVVDSMASSLEETFSDSSYDDIYSSVAEYIENVVDIDYAIVVVRYLNGDGTVIFEKEYTA